MAGWRLYDYIDERGINQFEQWSRGLESGDRAKLHRKLKALEDTEPGLIPGLLSGPINGYPHIYKLRIGGKVRLRPLLCKGPIEKDSELTLLMGATERDWKWNPHNAREVAVARRQEILNNPERRCIHVKVI